MQDAGYEFLFRFESSVSDIDMVEMEGKKKDDEDNDSVFNVKWNKILF